MTRFSHAYPLWLSLISLNLFGCIEQSSPRQDDGLTTERYCDGNDDDEDGKIDEGLLNECNGCQDENAGHCVLTSVALTTQTVDPVLPSAIQYRLHKPVPLEVMGLNCMRERVDTITPLSNTTLVLNQANAMHAWYSDPNRLSDAFPGVTFDGATPITLSGTSMNTQVTLTLTPPRPMEGLVQQALEECVDNFRATDGASDQPWRVDDTLFVGGSTRLTTVPGELTTAFFVLTGQVDEHPIELKSLAQSLPFSPDAVRCTVSKSQRVFQSVGVDGYQLSATSSASASAQFDEMLPPPQLQTRSTILYDGNVINISTEPLTGWGYPEQLEISRSGELNGTYSNERVRCILGENNTVVRINPDDVFDIWMTGASSEIVRVSWSEITTPVPNHPGLEFKNALTIQANRPD